jgi:hippurate hydrolase
MEEEIVRWRRHLHAHPECAFGEHQTSAFVAERLAAFGVQVDRGLAGTGVVGTLTTGNGPSIGLRADMDALPITEANTFEHRSRAPGRMHACGHDGHTVMLLAAARYLAETRRFSGTVHFIFQPAEENEGGGRVMIEQGLFERFPVRAVYGMHNWPGVEQGRFAVRAGPMMAAFDLFEIALVGRGAHAAMPHLGDDPTVAAAAVVMALQTVASRNVDPLDAAVVSVTQMQGGDTWNVIPDRTVLRGTARSLKAEVRDRVEAGIRRIADGVARAHGCRAEVRYERRYPPTVNDVGESERAALAAAEIVGADNVLRDLPPTMGAEDFAYRLEQKPGCYVWIGNGLTSDDPIDGGGGLHHPRYDFNDRILAIGASYWARLTERVLAP